MEQESLKKHYSSLHEDSSGKTLNQRLQDIHDNLMACGDGKPLSCKNVECHEQGNNFKRIIRQYCGYRICRHPGCIGKRNTMMRRKYDPKLNNFEDARFLTLTLRGYHPLDKTTHARLNYAWKRISLLLRKAGFVKAYIKVTELVAHEYIDAELVYHDVYYWHLHVIYDGTYIPAVMLRSAWKQYTKDSNWVHVERVKKNISAGAYIRKYVSKLVYDDLDLNEYFKVFKMKLISHYGCKDEIESLLEEWILIVRTVCPFCGGRLTPEYIDRSTH